MGWASFYPQGHPHSYTVVTFFTAVDLSHISFTDINAPLFQGLQKYYEEGHLFKILIMVSQSAM